MQTELPYTRCPSRPAAGRNRVTLRCEQLESRDAPSAAPLAAPYVLAAPASTSAVIAATPAASGTAVSQNVFALGGAADNGTGLSDASYAQALQNHAAAVLQDFASPAVAGSNGVVHAAAKSTTTTLTASTHAATAGQNVTLTAAVSASGSSAKPGGTVTFKDGSTVLGTATLDAHGVARLTTAKLPAGTDHLTAVYGGNASFKYSTSAATTVTVTNVVHAAAKSTTTTLTASTHAATAGQNVTLTAAVSASGSSAKPGGTVTFKDGSTVLGTATLDAHGVARLTTAKLPAGTDHLTAVYGGNASFKYSTSAATTVTVKAAPKPAAQVKLENLGDVTTAGMPLVLEATVKGATGGHLTILDGATSLGQIQLDRTGHAALAINLGLSAGRHTLTAVYQNGSVRATGSVSVTLTPSATPMW